ncbi:MAG TPA: flagellar hook capping FlgD N-terminal domain-containing protein [Acidimicrobiales bacterium]|nr:flagellar hook capping FlgD N-terminal domain-containing protein [Acidimicrobiales bacterium]
MTVIDPTSSQPAAAASSSSSTNALNQLDNTQEFLQLLVAQLQNQDPLNPEDPSQFMSEIAQLTQVQSQTTLGAEQQTATADSMLGFDVTGTASSGAQVQGVVSSVDLSSSGSPVLMVGTTALPLSSVTEVQQAAGASTPGATGATP